MSKAFEARWRRAPWEIQLRMLPLCLDLQRHKECPAGETTLPMPRLCEGFGGGDV